MGVLFFKTSFKIFIFIFVITFLFSPGNTDWKSMEKTLLIYDLKDQGGELPLPYDLTVSF